ncbi:MAG: transglutaminase family protein [Pseudomonadota bacterium]|jgi:transglutaminase-like putative cysteine protease
MRIQIEHTTEYHYDAPIRSAVQVLRLTPRPNASQHIVRWRVEADGEVRLRSCDDAYGNLTHWLEVEGPLDALRIHVSGEVETSDTGGILRGAVERAPVLTYLRETSLTAADTAMRAYCDDIVRARCEPLDQLHELLTALHRDIAFDTTVTDAETTAMAAFAHRHGVCQDIAHIFIGMSRWLNIPARYVSGHLLRRDGVVEQEAAHGWAEAYVQGLGWVGFDPANGCCPTEAYLRVATGPDYLAAAPVRGARVGGGSERLSVELHVSSPLRQQRAQQ